MEKIACPETPMPLCLIAPTKPIVVTLPRMDRPGTKDKDVDEVMRMICEADAACPTDPIYLPLEAPIDDAMTLTRERFTQMALNCFADDQVSDCITRYFAQYVDPKKVINPEAEKTTSAAALQKLLAAQPDSPLVPLRESGVSDARWTSERFTKLCTDKGFTPGKNCSVTCPANRIPEEDWGRCGPRPAAAGRIPGAAAGSGLSPSPLFQTPSLAGSPRVFSNPLQLRNLSIHYSI